MMFAEAARRPSRCSRHVLRVASVLLCACLSLEAQTKAPDPALAKLRSQAATQHEIALLLLSKKEFGKARAEAAKIFEMKWPADQEPILLKELLFFTDQFRHHAQPALGVELLDECRGSFRNRESIIAILKEKGFLYKEMKQEDQALECFREAQRLEKAPPQ